MDCRTALEILEVVRPGSDDLSDPELADAVAFLETHPECRRQFERRQELDRQMGRVMRDVPVPAGLKDRLLVGLAGETEDPAAATPEESGIDQDARNRPESPQQKRPLHRRGWLQAAAATAAAVLVGAVVWQLRDDPGGPLDLVQIQKEAALAVQANEFFDGVAASESELGRELAANWGLLIPIEGPKSLVLHQPDPVAGALYRFDVRRRRGESVTGYLLALPASRFESLPQAESFSAAKGAPRYFGRTIKAAAWKSDGVVYVCLIPQDLDFDVLERQIEPSAA